jgi:hypothetical protein
VSTIEQVKSCGHILYSVALAPESLDAQGAPFAQIRASPMPALFPTLASEPSALDPLPHATPMTGPRLFHTDVAPDLFQAARKTHPRHFHNSTARPVPPPHTDGNGICLLHASVAAAWPCPPSCTPTPVICTCNMKHKTLECNIHLKQMKYLGYTLATCVRNICNI